MILTFPKQQKKTKNVIAYINVYQNVEILGHILVTVLLQGQLFAASLETLRRASPSNSSKARKLTLCPDHF